MIKMLNIILGAAMISLSAAGAETLKPQAAAPAHQPLVLQPLTRLRAIRLLARQEPQAPILYFRPVQRLLRRFLVQRQLQASTV